MTARALMVQGTSSSAGKSLLVAALCGIYARRGVRVAPFKSQNMSNNAAVCPDGSEIGRAQAVQALAAGIELSPDINPILIKPEADAFSQVILMDKPYNRLTASAYYDHKQVFWGYVTSALDRLRAKFDLVIIEGAGSPVEINLKAGDIVNMAVARYAEAPVLLVGDIDRGGIFAQLLGTLWLLEPDERRLVRGLIANKFLGDPNLFTDGIRILEERGRVPVLGVIPYLKDLHIPEEDAVALDSQLARQKTPGATIDLAVIHLPHISNFDDFDPFHADPGVSVRYVAEPSAFGQPDAIILPGTKSTVADLNWLHATGLAGTILESASEGGAVVGVCGGYQMFGQSICDPDGVESTMENVAGLGLLPTRTIFEQQKATYQACARVLRPTAWMTGITGQAIEGYEIHMGRTEGNNPWLEITLRNGSPASVMDGAISPDGRIWGSYLHGYFSNTDFRRAWLRSIGWQLHPMRVPGPVEDSYQALVKLADAVEAALDMQKLEKILWDG